MKHKYTDEEIQAAIDAACSSHAHEFFMNSVALNPSNTFWPKETTGRLHLLKSALDKLPEPQPPTADGKTPGEFYNELARSEESNRFMKWSDFTEEDRASENKRLYAVIDAFSGAGLEQAIAMMEAVPLEELSRIWRVNSQTHHEDLKAIRARLIAAAREGHGPAAVDWKSRHDELQKAYAGHADVTAALHDKVQKSEAELAHRGALWANQVSTIQKLRAQLEECEAKPQLSSLRPIAEAGEVPAGAVRVFATWTGVRWIITTTQTVDTHCADILLPETKAPEPISGLEGLTKDRCMKLAKLGEDHTISAGTPDICPHASPHTYCETCKVSPCPIGLSLPEAKAPAVEADPYAELKAAHAEGKGLEYQDTFGNWHECRFPSWEYPAHTYRIKPADTFTAHDKTWNVHVPGDPMPKTGGRQIETLFNDGSGGTGSVETWEWQTTKYPPKGWRYADEPTTETEIFVNGAGNPVFPPSAPWTPAVGDVVTKANPVQDMALGGQMYWRDLARQLAEVWWKCHNIGASLQHGDIDTDVLFSVVCEKHGGQCFHADTPHNAWLKAEKWLISPDRANFPTATLQPAYESTKTGNLPDPLAEAVKRMEEVPTEELEDVYFDSTSMGCEGVQLPDDHDHGLARIRARLIQAAKGEQP